MTLDNVIARDQVRMLIERYSRAVSERDWDAVASVFHPDASWTVAPPFDLHFQTRNAIRDGISERVSASDYLVQMTHSVDIILEGADSAHARTVVNEMGRNTEKESGLFLLGVYVDELTRVEGQWGFASRRFEPIFVSTEWQPGMVIPRPA